MNVAPLLAAAAVAQLQPNNNPVANGRLDQATPAPLVVPRERPKKAVVTVGPGTTITAIRFVGSDAPAAVVAAATPFVGQQASQANLIELAGAISTAFEQTDIALYSIAIPDQDFHDGIVVVDLTDGWVDKVDVGGIAGPNRLVGNRARRLIGEKPLTRHRLERQMALIQAIPGLHADLSYDNPEGDDSVAIIGSGRQDRFQVAAGINNRGPHLLGSTILQAGVDAFSALVDGDQASASVYATPDFRHFRAFNLVYTTPIGIDGLALSASAGKIATRARDLDIKGKATFAGMSLSYAAIRSAHEAMDVSLGVDGVNSDNALFGNLFTTERTRAVRLAAAFAQSRGPTDLQLAASLSHGLGIFGARADATGGQTGFFKANASASLEHRFTPQFIGRLLAAAQITGNRLPGTELFSVGGPAIGRGFDTGIVSGDSGIGGLAELAFRPIEDGNFAKSEVYGFTDNARVRTHARLGAPGQSFSLASAGAGVRVNFKDKMQFGLEAAAILERPTPAVRKDYRLTFAYSIKF